MNAFTSFGDVLEHLDRLGLFNSDYSLTRMEKALVALRIDDGWRPFVVQVLGTNGKGSTATFLSCLARAHGVRTGLYTSPHFLSPRERIRIDGAMPSRASLVPLANMILDAAPELTYFEFMTVLGLLAFKRERCGFVVLEAGLGGRYDATTAMRADMVCYVPIDLDHCAILGNTVAAIASDKAAAIRPGRPVVTGVQPEDARAVLRREAVGKGSPFRMAEDVASLPDGVKLGLDGPHQRDNALLALAAWTLAAETMPMPISESSVRHGLGMAYIPGRFQRIPARRGCPSYLLDGGHNPHGLRSCLAAVEAGHVRLDAVIFSCLEDKAYREMLPVVLRMAHGVPLLLCTIQGNDRAMDGNAIAAACREAMTSRDATPSDIEVFSRLASALGRAETLPRTPDGAVLICGSLYLLGEFFTMNPRYLETCPSGGLCE